MHDPLANEVSSSGENTDNTLQPEDLDDYAIIGASYIAEGAITLQDVTVKMVKEFGPAIEKHMPKIFCEAKVIYDELDKVALEEPLEGEAKPKGRKPAMEQLKENWEICGRLVYEMVKEKVKSGLTTLDDVIQAITKDAQKVIPGITDREIRKLFLYSGEKSVTQKPNEEKDSSLINDALADAIDEVLLGAIKIAKGVRNAVQWMKEMRDENPEFTEYTDDQLEEVRQASQAYYDNNLKKDFGEETSFHEYEAEKNLECQKETSSLYTLSGSLSANFAADSNGASLPEDFGASNVVFTKEKAQEASRLIKRKLAQTDFNGKQV
jgi:Sec-independent protein translocase protein TatA